MLRNSIADFPGEVQPPAVVLEHVDDAEALLVMVESGWHQLIYHALAGVAERRMSEIVAQRNRFGELFVQTQDFRNRSRDLRDLERVRQARSIVIACRREEHLRLVLEPTERFAVDDAVAIPLKCWSDVVFGLGTEPAARLRALGCLRGEDVALARLEFLSNRGHTDVKRGDRRARREQLIILCGLSGLGALRRDLV